VYTLTQTPLRCGHPPRAGDFGLLLGFVLPFLTSCCMVSIAF
jgi:hypothetical protein